MAPKLAVKTLLRFRFSCLRGFGGARIIPGQRRPLLVIAEAVEQLLALLIGQRVEPEQAHQRQSLGGSPAQQRQLRVGRLCLDGINRFPAGRPGLGQQA